jgi:hypothetical protein
VFLYVVRDDLRDEAFELLVPAELVPVDLTVPFDDPAVIARARRSED